MFRVKKIRSKKRMNGGSQQFCTKCGARLELDLNHKFCTQCGTPIKKKSIKHVSKKQYCTDCGGELALETNFCVHCGSKLSQKNPNINHLVKFKLPSTTNPTQRRSSKKSTQRRSSKKSTQRRSSKKSTQRISSKKPTQHRSSISISTETINADTSKRLVRKYMDKFNPKNYSGNTILQQIYADTLKQIQSSYPYTGKMSIYGEIAPLPRNTYKKYDQVVHMMNDDTLDAFVSLKESNHHIKKWLAIDFANIQSPGGTPYLGSPAQEEKIIYRTNAIVPLLKAYKMRKKKSINKYLIGSNFFYPSLGGILMEDIDMFKKFTDRTQSKDYNIGPIKIDLFASAAFNLKNRYNRGGPPEDANGNVDEEQRIKQTQIKIRNQLRVAILNDYTGIILGAFGSGAFENKPEDIATFYRDILLEEEFKKKFQYVAFAIFDKKDANRPNFPIFQSIIEGDAAINQTFTVKDKSLIKKKQKLVKLQQSVHSKIIQCELIRGRKSQDIAQNYKGTGKKIAILVAGNAGRPGGVLGKMNGSGLTPHYKPPYNYTTQEEDIVASWLQAEEKEFNNPTVNPHIVFRKNLGLDVSGGRKWGMLYPDLHVGSPKSTHTIQGRDFTHPFYIFKVKTSNGDIIELDDLEQRLFHAGAMGYDFSGAKEINGEKRMDQAQNYNFAYTLKNKPIFDSKKKYIKKTDLVFVYGPNVSFTGTSPNSSGTRTLVKDYDFNRDYDVFRECVKTALKAGLIEMYNNKIQIAILAPISGGIYSGIKSGRKSETNKRINKEYIDIVNEILNENVAILGRHFEEVIFPKL